MVQFCIKNGWEMNALSISTALEVAFNGALDRYRELLDSFLARHETVVQTGPFAGLALSRRTSWGGGDMLPKLLGVYESELHPALHEILGLQPDILVNIGAAEGYYPIGLARLLPRLRCHAFDIAAEARSVCRETTVLNHVQDRVFVHGDCDHPTLQTLLAPAVRPVVICDCEGAERILLDPFPVPALFRATMIIECHDFLDRSITPLLIERFRNSHDVFLVREGARDPNAMGFLAGLNSLDRWIAVCEFRPETMHWLYCRPRQGT